MKRYVVFYLFHPRAIIRWLTNFETDELLMFTVGNVGVWFENEKITVTVKMMISRKKFMTRQIRFPL
jgi:hypothetical protein